MSNIKRQYCRLCAGFQPENKLIELQNNKSKCQDIAKKLSRLKIEVNLNDPVLHKVVCLTCVTSLERAINFVAAVEQGQLALGNLISVRQIKQENVDSSSDEDCANKDDALPITYDALPITYVNNAAVKSESSKSTVSRNENPGHGDSHVYTQNVHIKGESRNVNVTTSEQGQEVLTDNDTRGSSEVNVNIKSESAKVDLKRKMAKKRDETGSENDNFIYVVLEEDNNSGADVKPKKKVVSTAKSASSSTGNRKSRKGTIYINRWSKLPLSEMDLSWNDYTWTCSYCETQFPTFNELRSHSMQYHNACNPYQCTDCKTRKLHINSFLVHVKRHRQYLKFWCYKCPMKFSTQLEAAQHRTAHMNSDFICFGCNMVFSNQDEWFKHTRRFYKNTRATSILALQDDSLKCYMCDKVFKNKNQLNSHLLTHTNNICEICGKCFYQKCALQTHLITHSDARPFQCDICTASFKTQRRLKLHIATHDGSRPFGCDICGKCFRLKSHLGKHMIIHTDNLPHVCTYCNRGFRNRGLLNQHVRQHTGVKPYSCDICNRDFTNWANYNKHMKRRHDMNMAKTKRTPSGSFPIDPNTGEVMYPPENKITQWKQKILEIESTQRRVTKKKKVIPISNDD